MPQNPVQLDRDARVTLMGEEGTFQVLEAREVVPVHGQYTVTGMEPAINEPDSGLTINRLIAAGTDYPDWVEPFREVHGGDRGPGDHQGGCRPAGEAAPNERDPYRLAEAIQDYLRDEPFQLRTGHDLPLG